MSSRKSEESRAEHTVAAELAALRGEMERAAAAPAAERSEGHLQVEQLLQELQSVLSEAAEGAGEVIAEHPLPSVSAAFFLGLAVGWLAARS